MVDFLKHMEFEVSKNWDKLDLICLFLGRTLFMLNDNLLLEMGINDSQDR